MYISCLNIWEKCSSALMVGGVEIKILIYFWKSLVEYKL